MAALTKPRKTSHNQSKEEHAKYMRAWRIKRERERWKQRWMIGYDGPSSNPGSWWPRILEMSRM